MEEALSALSRAIANLTSRVRSLEVAEQKLGSWTTATLLNSWVSVGTAASYWKDPWGNVRLSGTVNSGSGVIMTLPAGYRPGLAIRIPVVANSLFGAVNIATTGDVTLSVGAGPVALDSISFRAD